MSYAEGTIDFQIGKLDTSMLSSALVSLHNYTKYLVVLIGKYGGITCKLPYGNYGSQKAERSTRFLYAGLPSKKQDC